MPIMPMSLIALLFFINSACYNKVECDSHAVVFLRSASFGGMHANDSQTSFLLVPPKLTLYDIICGAFIYQVGAVEFAAALIVIY